MKYCLVKDGTILKYNTTKPKIVVGTQDGIYLPLEDNQPTINTATHKISGSTYTVQTDKVVKTYTVVEISLEEILKATQTKFKNKYLSYVDTKLKELDYDSLATVKLWEDDANYGAEATKILTWYKAIIAMNYQLITDVTSQVVPIPTDEEYQIMLEAIPFG